MDSDHQFLRTGWPVFAPLATALVLLFLFCGGEDSVALFSEYCRDAFPGLKRGVTLLTRYGGIPYYCLWGAVLVTAVRRRDRRGVCLVGYYLLFLLLVLLVADMVKIWVGRPRPGEFGGLIPFTLLRSHHSFPSNHVMEAVVTILPLAQYFRHQGWALGCGIWLALLSLARIFLGRHHPSDVAGSAIIAAAAVACLWYCVERSVGNGGTAMNGVEPASATVIPRRGS